MIILNKPYVSDFLVETIKKNNFPVLDNEIARKYFSKDKLFSFQNISSDNVFYSNSENSIDLIIENMPQGNLCEMIKISKDKILFRNMLKKIYPDFYFKEVNLDEIKSIDVNELKFPFILKPSVGFLSFGVYPIKNISDWYNVLKKIDLDIENFKNIFPKSVVNTQKFIIEEMIEGIEYAIDAYFDESGKAVILNIFLHPFFDENDVSDRAYYTSKNIIKENLEQFQKLLDKIGEVGCFKNFPFHLELRKNEEKIIPIEINPMRFCGWCITDIAQNAWGINVYEYYCNKIKPNWDEILNSASDDYFYFTIADIPSGIDRSKIKDIKFDSYMKNIKNPLEIRKIDYKNNPIFAIIFAKADNLNEIKNILKLDMKNFIEL